MELTPEQISGLLEFKLESVKSKDAVDYDQLSDLLDKAIEDANNR